MPLKSVLPWRWLLLCVLLGACQTGLDDGFGVAITATFDISVTGEDLARVTAFQFVASGDESYSKTVDLGRTVNRVERVIYRPKSSTRKLMLALIALDKDNAVIAEGTTSMLDLKPGVTAQASITLLPAGEVDLGIRLDGGGRDMSAGVNPDGDVPEGVAISFVTTPAVPTGTSPVDVATGDFNGDGRPDVAVAAKGAGKVQVFFTRADGTLPALPSFESTVATSPVALAAADFTKDGKTDLAVLDAQNGSVTLLVNMGEGALKANASIPIGAGADSMAVGDFDQDGIPDLAFGASTVSSVWILYNNAAHTTLSRTTMGAVARVRTGDMDGDGFLDVVACETGSNVVQIVLNTQTAVPNTFATSKFITLTADGVVEALVFDYDVDGKTDIYAFTPTASGGNVTALHNLGAGMFAAPMVLTGPDSGSAADNHALAVDLDGDGILDVVAASGDTTGAGSQQVVVAIGKSNKPPVYNKAVVFYTSEGGLGAMAAADLDGDGSLDIVIANEVSNTVAVAIGSKTGALTAARAFAQSTHPRIYDFNDDGIPDVGIINLGVQLLAGDNHGALVNGFGVSFSTATQSTVADLNGDKITDTIMSGSDGTACVALGTGAGKFGTPTIKSYGTSFIDVGSSDFDNDMNADIVLLDNSSTADSAGRNVVVLPGDGTGGFKTPAYYAAASPVAFVVTDVNNDGHADVVVVSSTSQVTVLVDGATSLEGPMHFTAGAGHPTGIAVLKSNRDGHVDLAISGDTTHVLLGASDGTFIDHGVVYSQQSNSIAAGDVDGDGFDDIMVMTDHSFIVLPGAVANSGTPIEFAGGAVLSSLTAGNLTSDKLVDVIAVGRRASVIINSTH